MQDGQPMMPGMGAGGNFGILPGMLGQFLMKNPADSAMNYYDQIPGMLQKYLSPYMNIGMGATNNLQSTFSQLMQNPTFKMNQIGQGYQQSPGYQFQRNQDMNAMNNSQAAGGMAGTPSSQYQMGQMANGLANQDYYGYVDRGMNQFDTGLQGEQGLSQQGFNAGTDLAGMFSSLLQNQGNLAYAGTQGQNNTLLGMLGMGSSL